MNASGNNRRSAGDPVERIVSGSIPWTRREYESMVEVISDVLAMPKDDWDHDLGKKPFMHDGQQAYRLNTFNPGPQIIAQFRSRYPERLVWQSHWWRFQGIGAMIDERSPDLARRGLVHLDGDEVADIHPALLDVLCATTLRDIDADDPSASMADIFPADILDAAVRRAHELGDFGPT